MTEISNNSAWKSHRKPKISYRMAQLVFQHDTAPICIYFKVLELFLTSMAVEKQCSFIVLYLQIRLFKDQTMPWSILSLYAYTSTKR